MTFDEGTSIMWRATAVAPRCTERTIPRPARLSGTTTILPHEPPHRCVLLVAEARIAGGSRGEAQRRRRGLRAAGARSDSQWALAALAHGGAPARRGHPDPVGDDRDAR